MESPEIAITATMVVLHSCFQTYLGISPSPHPLVVQAAYATVFWKDMQGPDIESSSDTSAVRQATSMTSIGFEELTDSIHLHFSWDRDGQGWTGMERDRDLHQAHRRQRDAPCTVLRHIPQQRWCLLLVEDGGGSSHLGEVHHGTILLGSNEDFNRSEEF